MEKNIPGRRNGQFKDGESKVDGQQWRMVSEGVGEVQAVEGLRPRHTFGFYTECNGEPQNERQSKEIWYSHNVAEEQSARTCTHTQFSENCIVLYCIRLPPRGTCLMAGLGLDAQSLSKLCAGFQQRKQTT